MESLRVYKVFWILNICFADWLGTSFASQSFHISRENLNRRLVTCTFLEVNVDSLHDCARACFYFGGECKSINFNKKSKTCELNNKASVWADDAEFEKNGEYIFADITEWPKVMTSGCSKENCDEHQICRPHGKGDFTCTNKANCGDPPPIANGFVSAPVTLDGAIATYSCDNGFENLGNFTKRKCVRGTWSEETISCTLKDCYYFGKSHEYDGQMQNTISGHLCQVWTHYNLENMDHNYCRDPNKHGKPWCYTGNPVVNWGHCPVPLC